jgi:hypothetical protein
MDTLLSTFIKKRALPELELRSHLIHYGRKRSAELILSQDYDRAAQTDRAVDLLVETLRQERERHEGSEQNQALRDRLTLARDAERDLVQKKQHRLDQARNSTRMKLERLDQQHELERSDFEREWNSTETRIPFQKPSPQLLQLRNRQKVFALCHDFKNARALRIQAEAMEKREATEATRRYEEAMKVAWGQLVEKQEKERQCLLENRDRIMTVTVRERDNELASNELAKKLLDTRLQWPKHSKRPIIQLPTSKGSGSPSFAALTLQPVTYSMMTQRTRTQLAGYRKEPDTRRLELKPREVKKVVDLSPRKRRESLHTS